MVIYNEFNFGLAARAFVHDVVGISKCDVNLHVHTQVIKWNCECKSAFIHIFMQEFVTLSGSCFGDGVTLSIMYVILRPNYVSHNDYRNSRSGHYTAMRRQDNGKWVLYNDLTVR